MHESMREDTRERVGWHEEHKELSIAPATQPVTETHRTQGTRSPLALVWMDVLRANAAGETTVQARAEWFRRRGSGRPAMRPEVRARYPCAAPSSQG